MSRQNILSVVLASYILFLLDIALFQFPVMNPRTNWVPFRSILTDWRYGGWGFVINFLGNIVSCYSRIG